MADEEKQGKTGGRALGETPERADASDQRVVGGRYRLLAVIGRGGMSTVYLALDTALNKQWAAKEIRHVSDPAQRELIVNSIVTEANMIKRFDHPAIPRIVDIVDEAGTLYVIMDYVEGRTLEDVLAAGGPQSEDDVMDWALQLCEVLEYLHTRTPSVIYRDMKPSNVMLKPNGLVQVIDFGIAREMREGGQGASAAIGDTVQLGTRGFAPPEQYGGTAQTDARSDVYSLGATMYNLLTDKSPAEPPYEMLPLRQVRPELSQGIERIVARATQANPDDRYQDCAEMAYDLAHYREQDDAARSRLKRTWHTFVGLAAATVVALVVGVSGTVGRIVATNGDYGHWMQIAEQSSDDAESCEAYLRAIEIRPGDVEPYLGLVDRYRADLTFSPEEEAQLRSAVLPNLAALEARPATRAWPLRSGSSTGTATTSTRPRRPRSTVRSSRRAAPQGSVRRSSGWTPPPPTPSSRTRRSRRPTRTSPTSTPPSSRSSTRGPTRASTRRTSPSSRRWWKAWPPGTTTSCGSRRQTSRSTR